MKITQDIIQEAQYQESSESSASGRQKDSGVSVGDKTQDRNSQESSRASFDNEDNFELIIRQHPVRARAVGFGDRDRRPIDPPPVVQLKVKDTQGNNITQFDAYTHLVCHISLIAADCMDDKSIVINPFQHSDKGPIYASSIIGNLISPCYLLNDDKDERGFFFSFPDVSCRISGTYRLKFLLFDLNDLTTNATSGILPEYSPLNAIGSATSQPFTVYHPKEFPGMSESTELSKVFSRQGVRIHIRNSDTRTNASKN